MLLWWSHYLRGGKETDAENQNAVASYIHFHKRLLLKITQKGTNLIKDDANDLQHYSIVQLQILGFSNPKEKGK